MSDVPDALVEKAAEAMRGIEESWGERLPASESRMRARAALAAVWPDLAEEKRRAIESALIFAAAHDLPAARPVVDADALADEVAARIEGSQSPLRDVPQADMAYERAAQDARDAIHASENVQDAADLAEMLRAEAQRIAPPYKRTVGATERAIALCRAAHFIEHGSWPEGDAEFTDTLPTPDTVSWSAPVQDAADVRRAVAEETWDRRGGALWLDREQWGVVIDALIQHRGHADQRKAANSASNSDVRSDMCAELIERISSAARIAREAGEPR